MHNYSGVTAAVTASGTLLGWIKADVKLDYAVGEYITIGSEVCDHVKGKKTVTGTITKAWGVDSDTLYTWFNSRNEFDIVFSAGSTGSPEDYTASGCILTSLDLSVEAGSSDPLEVVAAFKGRDWSSA